MTTRLSIQFKKSVLPQLAKELNIKNIHGAPFIKKVAINVGIGKIKDNPAGIRKVFNDVWRLTGQKPVMTKSRKAISGFKLRAGENVGIKVTLRGKKMYDFLDRLIHTALPSVRDFRGIKNSAVDSKGNLTIGLREHVVFPEISFESVEGVFGLEVSIVTSAKDASQALKLYKAIGIPFAKGE